MSRRSRARQRRARQSPAPNGVPTGSGAVPVAEATAPVEPTTAVQRAAPVVSDRLFVVLGLGILLVALVLRVSALALNPFHHDEGINGWFVTQLVRSGEWSYDPANYHGPTLFYFGFVAEIFLGLTTEAMRLVPAVFGLGTVALVLALRPFVGSLAALIGAALLAISPGATYVSRYFIHEALVVFFTLAIVVAVVYFLRRGQERYLVLAACSAALLFATKETGIVNVGVLAIAVGVGVVYLRIRGHVDGAGGGVGSSAGSPRTPGRRTTRASARKGGTWDDHLTLDRIGLAIVCFVTLYVLFFSSFLGNMEGLIDSLATFTIWIQTGAETQVQPFQQYLVWMLRADAPILLLGLGGGLIVAWRPNSLLAVVIGLWALGITAAFSLVSYKTPWIALNMLVPLAILAGIGVDHAARSVRDLRLRVAGTAVLAASIALSGYQAYDINFVHYDDETYPYVFVHTTRQALDLVEETQRIGRAAGTNQETGIAFVTPEYWPLPWYYRNEPGAGFFGNVVPTDEAMIVARIDQAEELQASVEERYVRKGTYNLRPGVDLVLFVRSDLADL